MNKSQAIQKFWSSFGLNAYDETTVPQDAQMPYITYSVSETDFGFPTALGASLWYKSPSWEDIELKSYEIAKAITPAGITMPIDGGLLWIYKGSPYANRMSDTDDTVRRILLNITAEYLTND